MSLDRADGEALFGLLEDPDTAPAFFDRVADDVIGRNERRELVVWR